MNDIPITRGRRSPKSPAEVNADPLCIVLVATSKGRENHQLPAAHQALVSVVHWALESPRVLELWVSPTSHHSDISRDITRESDQYMTEMIWLQIQDIGILTGREICHFCKASNHSFCGFVWKSRQAISMDWNILFPCLWKTVYHNIIKYNAHVWFPRCWRIPDLDVPWCITMEVCNDESVFMAFLLISFCRRGETLHEPPNEGGATDGQQIVRKSFSWSSKPIRRRS